ncbi:hypothetical protein [Ligilactobacillus aviarius]|uniref:hypothetical protein n=1 Tax=Ligilactobacillus aviarius TaxID=1606 RepID=UPI0024B87B69|nr:hypothetical protein [Ligilactobacillus aviarius]
MNEELIEKAQQAYDNGHYDQAVALMEEAYLKNKNFHNNYYLFKFLKKDQKWVQAVTVANEYLNEYIQNDDYFYQYFDCRLHVGDVLGCFELLNQLDPYLNSTERQTLAQKVKLYPSYLSKEQQELKQNVLRKLKYLGGFSIHEQREILNSVNFLNPQELFLNCRSVFLDQDVPCVVRMSLLNTLRKVLNNQVKVLNLFNEVIQVDLSKLAPIEELPVYAKIKQRIFDSKKIAEPLKLRMFSEAKMKLFVVYPEIEQIDQDDLVKIALMQTENLSSKGTILNQQINREIDKINDFKI